MPFNKRDLGLRIEAARQTFLYVPLHFWTAFAPLETSLRRRGPPFFAADRRLPRNSSQVVADRRPMLQAAVSVSIPPKIQALAMLLRPVPNCLWQSLST
jgi:hypothetical protein